MIPRASLSEAAWIWTPHYDDATDPAKLVLFRKSFTLETLPETPFTVHVSADTRYRLFVNGERVSFGPCKSYLSRWYYETVDILPCLKVGPNVISAKVLRFSSAQPGNSSMVQAHIPGFFLFARNEVSVLGRARSHLPDIRCSDQLL